MIKIAQTDRDDKENMMEKIGKLLQNYCKHLQFITNAKTLFFVQKSCVMMGIDSLLQRSTGGQNKIEETCRQTA